MAVATTTALLIGAGIAAGSSVGAAKMASGAAKGAAETQAESADKALAVNERIYQQQRADTLPMLNRANQAGATLSGLMGLPTGPPPGPTGVPDTIGPPPGAIPDQYGRGFGILKPGVTPEQALLPIAEQQRLGIGSGLPRQNPGTLGTDPQAVQRGQNASSYVQMRAPTGEVQPVPADQVDHYQRMGAVRV